ncbi:MAG: rhomboid family intramembrane serine protease [Chitinivibrionales bacterium]|nr:rhomboid family intramembrane serine protease [Chitinivibrionales bacterium]
MFPLKCESTGTKIPFATLSLIILCIAAYIRHDLIEPYAKGFIPLYFANALFNPIEYGPQAMISLFSSLFTHAGIMHLISNMWYLWIFGYAVEQDTGAGKFIIIYVACGILSMLIQGVSDPLSSVPIVGASGAIAGIMGLHLILLPLSKILVWIPPIFIFKVWAFIFLILWFGVQYVSLRSSSPQSAGVAWWAHMGGYVSGSLWGIVLRIRNRNTQPTVRSRKKKAVTQKKV